MIKAWAKSFNLKFKLEFALFGFNNRRPRTIISVTVKRSNVKEEAVGVMGYGWRFMDGKVG